MTHLNSDELIDAVEGMLDADRQAHLAACEQCRGEVANLSIVLADARQVSVPEPSPLFWQHFSQRVRTAIANDAAPGHDWSSWLRWQVLAPLGALALVILALMIAVPKQRALIAPVARVAPAIVTSEGSENWLMVADLVGDIDIDTAAAAGVVVTPGATDRVVLELTAAEQQELTRLLTAELTRAKS